MFDSEHVRIQGQITQIQNIKGLTNQQKKERIKTIKQSILQGTDSSFKVITSIANTMIGSAMIVYPILFIKDGIIGSTMIMLIIGLVQYTTCRILVVHNRKGEAAYSMTIKRICGKNIYSLNALVNFFLLFFVSCVYFLLVVQNFFQVSAAIISSFTDYIPPKTNTIEFSKYSIQWGTIIGVIFCVPLLFWKSIDGLLKLMKFSIFCVAAYGLFILLCLFRQIIQGNIVFSQYKLFDPDFSNVAGAFALSFLIHPTAAPILKKNKIQSNNFRDLFLGYCLTAFIYFFVGFIGGLTCATSVTQILDHPDQFSTIFDCVNAKSNSQEIAFYVIGKIVQFGILFQNVTVFPVIHFLARKQLIDLIDKPKWSNKIFIIETIILLIVASLISILCIDVSIILSFDGAIVGFFMAYGIPIYMHLVCYFKKLSPQQKKLRASLLSSTESQQLKEAGLQQGLDVHFEQSDQPEDIEQRIRCNAHTPKDKLSHFILYGSLIILGIALGIFKIYSFFE